MLNKIYSNISNIRKDQFNIIKERVNCLFNLEWPQLKNQIELFYKKNPKAVNEFFRKLGFGFAFDFDIGGTDELLGSYIRDRGIDLSKIEYNNIEDSELKYFKDWFTEESLNAYKKAMETYLEDTHNDKSKGMKEATHGNIVGENELMNNFKANNILTYLKKRVNCSEELLSILLNIYKKDDLLKNINTLKNPADIEEIINRMKPVFDFFRNNGIDLLSDFLAKKKEFVEKTKKDLESESNKEYFLDFSMRGFNSKLKDESFLIYERIIYGISEEFEKNFASFEDLKNVKNITPVIRYRNEVIKELKEIKEEELDNESIKKVDYFLEILENKKCPKDFEEKIDSIKDDLMLERLTLPLESYLEHFDEYKKMMDLKEKIKENENKKDKDYYKICVYLELGDYCRLLKSKSVLEEIEQQINDLKEKMKLIELTDSYNPTDKDKEKIMNDFEIKEQDVKIILNYHNLLNTNNIKPGLIETKKYKETKKLFNKKLLNKKEIKTINMYEGILDYFVEYLSEKKDLKVSKYPVKKMYNQLVNAFNNMKTISTLEYHLKLSENPGNVFTHMKKQFLELKIDYLKNKNT